MRWFVDTNVLLYAVGGAHAAREPCRRFLDRALDAGATLHVSVETLQELLFHRMRRVTRTEALHEVEVIRAVTVVHPVTDEVFTASLELIRGSTLRGRDALIAATALRRGFDTIVSTDPDLDGIPGLTRLDPTSPPP